MIRSFCFFFLLAPLGLFSQAPAPAEELQVIRETLPAFLDRQLSPVTFTRGGRMYELIHAMMAFGARISQEDSIMEQYRADSLALEQSADSVQEMLDQRGVTVRVADSLYPYRYVPAEYTDLRKPEDWEEKAEQLREDFVENRMHRLDTAIGAGWIPLLKAQVDLQADTVFIDLKTLDKGYYQFQSWQEPCDDQSELCLDLLQIFRVVFNEAGDKACYPLTWECRHGICKSFLLAEKRNGRWYYVEEYPASPFERY